MFRIFFAKNLSQNLTFLQNCDMGIAKNNCSQKLTKPRAWFKICLLTNFKPCSSF